MGLRKIKQLSELKEWDKNPREIGERELKGLKVSIEEFGDLSGVVYNTRLNALVSGHQRIRALNEQYGDTLKIQDNQIVTPGGEVFKIRLVSWDEGKHTAANIAANNPYIAGDFNDRIVVLVDDLEKCNEILFNSLNVDDLKHDLNKLWRDDEKSEKAEVKFTEELLESRNYVVLYFENEVDWLHLQSLYPLHSVKALDSKKGFTKIGIGRVIKGIDFLKKIQER